MHKSKVWGLAIAFLAPFVLQPIQPAQAEMLVLGTASTGETLTLDTNSVNRAPRAGSVLGNATYYLNDERIDAEIDCGRGYWTVRGSSTQYRPQSQATRNLLSLACSISRIDDQREDTGYLLVYDPPSNVRSSPNGAVQCVIDTMRVIRVYSEPRNGWYFTDACPNGRGGNVINESQVRPLR